MRLHSVCNSCSRHTRPHSGCQMCGFSYCFFLFSSRVKSVLFVQSLVEYSFAVLLFSSPTMLVFSGYAYLRRGVSSACFVFYDHVLGFIPLIIQQHLWTFVIWYLSVSVWLTLFNEYHVNEINALYRKKGIQSFLSEHQSFIDITQLKRPEAGSLITYISDLF